MSRKRLPFPLLLAAVVSSHVFAQPLSLDRLVQEAVDNNPAIKAAYSSWQAAEYKIKQAASLPDPQARFSFFGKNIETKTGPQEAKYGLAQKFPFPGKLSLKGEVAEKEARMAKERYEAVKREVIRKVKFAYYDLWWVDQAIKVTQLEKDITGNLERAARQKFEANQAPQQDVVKAQVAISELIDKLFTLKQRRKSLAAKMNSLLDREEGLPLGRLRKFEIKEFTYPLKELIGLAKENRQELIIADLDIAKKENEESLARLDYFPDFTFGVDYIQIGGGSTNLSNDGEDAWMGMVGINLPIWRHRLNAQLKEKRESLKAGRSTYEDVKNRVSFEVEDLYFKITAYKDIVALYEDALIPQTEQSFKTAKTAYETGRVDFLNWLDSEKVLLRTRLAYYKAVADYEKSIAFLERIVGKDL